MHAWRSRLDSILTEAMTVSEELAMLLVSVGVICIALWFPARALRRQYASGRVIHLYSDPLSGGWAIVEAPAPDVEPTCHPVVALPDEL
jgi:hypothetical protein